MHGNELVASQGLEIARPRSRVEAADHAELHKVRSKEADWASNTKRTEETLGAVHFALKRGHLIPTCETGRRVAVSRGSIERYGGESRIKMGHAILQGKAIEESVSGENLTWGRCWDRFEKRFVEFQGSLIMDGVALDQCDGVFASYIGQDRKKSIEWIRRQTETIGKANVRSPRPLIVERMRFLSLVLQSYGIVVFGPYQPS